MGSIEGIGQGKMTGEWLQEQAEQAEQHGLTTLLFCPNAWALRHRFVNQETGETVRARCDSWHCLYCGPRKVDQWRQLVKVAEPTLFVTLTMVGWTVEEASRVLTTVVQYLRRGSKGKGKNRIGARPAYPIEWFAVLERHSDFERVGFHWHLLIKGVDFLPKQVLSDALASATKGRSIIVDVQRVRSRAIGYVTKYLTKHITAGEQGTKTYQRVVKCPVLHAVEDIYDEQGGTYLYTVSEDEQGQMIEKQDIEEVEQTSKARRIRYSRHFFPASTAALRQRLFSGMDRDDTDTLVEGRNDTPSLEIAPIADNNEEGLEDTEQPEKPRSVWVLHEAEPFSHAVEDYERRRRQALVEALVEMYERRRRLSRRIIGMWAYQRNELRWAS
jgi:hypothetical protein